MAILETFWQILAKKGEKGIGNSAMKRIGVALGYVFHKEGKDSAIIFFKRPNCIWVHDFEQGNLMKLEETI